MLDVWPSRRSRCGHVERVAIGEELLFESGESVLRISGFLHALVLTPAAVALLQFLDEGCKGECAEAHGNLLIPVCRRMGILDQLAGTAGQRRDEKTSPLTTRRGTLLTLVAKWQFLLNWQRARNRDKSSSPEECRQAKRAASATLGFHKLGRLVGVEPTTSGSTDRRSATEL
jgi:hypothetical protein